MSDPNQEASRELIAKEPVLRPRILVIDECQSLFRQGKPEDRRAVVTDEFLQSLRGGLLDLSRHAAAPGTPMEFPAPEPCSVCGQPFTPGVFFNHDPETGAVRHRGECPPRQDGGT